ncbi:hypothetical protein J8J27_35190, partial [Mycobacterium tuberculosis]|nr:hypothetical protein [Mycobacterium tuberculosis]
TWRSGGRSIGFTRPKGLIDDIHPPEGSATAAARAVSAGRVAAQTAERSKLCRLVGYPSTQHVRTGATAKRKQPPLSA